jgi:hypothetical protein
MPYSPELDISVVIDGATDLTLSEANGYYVMAVGPGQRVWRRVVETSPFVHGEDEISRTLAPGSIRLQVLVRATTHANLATRIANLINVLEQGSYVLTWTVEGVSESRRCRCADTSVGNSDSLDANRLRNVEQIVTATIPCHPVPIT